MHHSTKSNRLILIQSLDNLKSLRIIRPLLPNNKTSNYKFDLTASRSPIEEFKNISLEDLQENIGNSSLNPSIDSINN